VKYTTTQNQATFPVVTQAEDFRKMKQVPEYVALDDL